MKKLEGRSFICLLLVLAMMAGLIYFIARLEANGSDWAGFYANGHIFSKGLLKAGEIKDRDGDELLEYDSEGAHYSGKEYQRRAVSAVVGDIGNNIHTGANVMFRSQLVGYNPVTGTEGLLGLKGGTVTLSIDKDLNETAYSALGRYNGFVSVFDYTTGDILCLVSTPTVDPQDPGASSTASSGAYINKVFSSAFAPGSTFKLITAYAAIENIDDIWDRTFTCTGSQEIGGSKITCPAVHGTMDFKGALANSCNCVFGQLAAEMGSKTMSKYTEKAGLTESYNINGIETRAGSFNFDSSDIDLAWAGIGQFEDEANPLAMMVYAGAIAGEGTCSEPSILKGKSSGTVHLMDADTAADLKEMLRNNVINKYGDYNYPDLNLGAKSGTAETGDGSTNAWFIGYTGNYAFVVMAENGGSGASVAGPIANTVLQKLKEMESN